MIGSVTTTSVYGRDLATGGRDAESALQMLRRRQPPYTTPAIVMREGCCAEACATRNSQPGQSRLLHAPRLPYSCRRPRRR